MKSLSIFLALLVASSPVMASECRTVDISSWTQNQKNLLAAVSDELMFDAGHTTPHTSWSNVTGQICYDNPLVNLETVLTESAILARYASDESARQTAAEEAILRDLAFEAEITGSGGNDYCSAELSSIDTKLDALKAANQADINGITNIASAKTALTNINNRYDVALRKIAKCLRARAR